MKAPESKKVWFVAHPTHQYAENVRELARQHNLRIVDARFDDGTGTKGPALTVKGSESAQDQGSTGPGDSESPEKAEAEDDESEELGANIQKMIVWFRETQITKKPLVKEVEQALDIDTNGTDIDTAWSEYKG